MKQKILVVDDEKDIVEFIQYNLEQEGFDVISAYNGKEALELIEENPSLILLDVMMPEVDGYEVCRKIRKNEKYKNTPILFLTAKISEQDEIEGLNVGADDYITKPVSIRKLLARIKSNIRQSDIGNDKQNSVIEVGPVRIDKEEYLLYLNNEKIVLPRKEFEIISYLASKNGKVIPREKLLNSIWGVDVFVGDRTIDVHVRKIREKLGTYSKLIETVKGVGYRFKSDK
jgi:two-component system alkaline phosphatase synthesis response regulator PhoP